MVHTEGKKKQLIEIILKEAQMFALLVKDFKVTIKNISKELKEIMCKQLKEIMSTMCH